MMKPTPEPIPPCGDGQDAAPAGPRGLIRGPGGAHNQVGWRRMALMRASVRAEATFPPPALSLVARDPAPSIARTPQIISNRKFNSQKNSSK